MAKHDKTISYDAENDLLFIHKGFSNDERFKGNVDIGDLILDISTKGRVRGIEVMNASGFFKDFLKDQLLKDLKDADFTTKTTPKGITISIVLKAKYDIPATIAVPLQVAKLEF